MEVLYHHIHEGDKLDEQLVASWVRQAAELPWETCFLVAVDCPPGSVS